MKTNIPRLRRSRVLSLAAAISLVALLLPVTVGVVAAHNYSASLQCSAAGNVPTLTVSLSNYAGSPYVNTVTITIDGSLDSADSSANFGTGYSLTKVLTPATVSHTAIVAVVAGDNSAYSHTFNLSVPACQSPSPSPTTPTIATSLSGGNQSGPSITVPIGTTVTDTAFVSAVSPTVPTAPVPTGTVTFTVYTSSDCSTGAQSAGTGTLSGGQATSSGIQFDHAGTWYWEAVYNGDANFNSVTSACTVEVVTVSKSQPSISTFLSSGESSGTTLTDIALGSSVFDTATLTGLANGTTTGTVAFTVYTSSDCETGGQSAGSTQAVSSGQATSQTIVVDQAGTYYWKAVYSGDPDNLGATSPCTAETITVVKTNPTLPTTKSPGGLIGTVLNDGATVTGGYNPTGSITFRLYGPGTSCDTDPIYTQTVPLGEGSATAATTPGFTTVALGTYEWTAVYSGDPNNNTASSGCGEEAVVISRTPTCEELGTCPSPSPSPPVSPSPSPSPSPNIVSPSPSPQGSVEAVTSKPHVTPPPTSSMGGTPGGPSSGIWLFIIVLAGLLASILLLTPAVPARARRRR